MDIIISEINGIKLAEIVSDELLIKNVQNALDILVNIYYQDIDNIILHEKNITFDFFDLKNKMAGDILQKFSNYRVKLAIVGDFSKYISKSVHDFIYESNKLGHINFVASLEEAKQRFVKNK